MVRDDLANKSVITSHQMGTLCKSHSMLSGACTSKKFHNKPLKRPNHKMLCNI